MVKEIKSRKDYLNGEVISSIYFGGGTPSILTTSEINTFLKTIYKFYQVNDDSEITIECNPDDVSLEKIEVWKKNSFNRVSLGIQSFIDSDFNEVDIFYNNEKKEKISKVEKKVLADKIVDKIVSKLN